VVAAVEDLTKSSLRLETATKLLVRLTVALGALTIVLIAFAAAS
jgi:hypothetical protein